MKPRFLTVGHGSFIASKQGNLSLQAKGANDESLMIVYRFIPGLESQRFLRHTGPDPLWSLTLANDVLLHLTSIMPIGYVDWIGFVVESLFFLHWVELAQRNVSRLYEHIHGIISKYYHVNGSGNLRFRPIVRPQSDATPDVAKANAIPPHVNQAVMPVIKLRPGFFCLEHCREF